MPSTITGAKNQWLTMLVVPEENLNYYYSAKWDNIKPTPNGFLL